MADDQFPPEIIYKIFSRTPIKSLARFQCVSKLWLNYITHPYLQTIHPGSKQETMHPIIFQQSHRPLRPGKKKECEISFLRVIQGTTNVQKHPVLNFCYGGPSYGTREKLVLGSCNGLILVRYVKNPGVVSDFFLMAVIDPLTKQRRDLPPVNVKIIGSDRTKEAAGIGIDDSTHTLKTVFVIVGEEQKLQNRQLCAKTMVHCPGNKVWREIGETPAYPISGEGVFGHGRLHWLVRRKIVWFDVKRERFGLTDPPDPNKASWSRSYRRLVALNDGEVGFAFVGDVCTELWVLKEDQEWVLGCWFDLDVSPVLRLRDGNVEVLGCWNEDGDILLSCGRGNGRRLCVYGPKTGDFRRVVGVDDLGDAEVRMYRSNLFSRLTRFKTFKW
ncbi:hypothetical protein SSX86_019462 [Deinandra increscens subsp. villosa]|uniref:F-box domain-containing protein n=1 Tax=Deinandra increscens subsp. villosa TaxID=3103831 RepID=A0AAP0CSQ6_9ASTR